MRAVASSSLIPISERLIELFPGSKLFSTVVMCLWNALQELDDLTAATTFVMDLIADLIKQPTIVQVMKFEANDFFEKLVPQLFPFFRHAIYSVRVAVVRTLRTLASISLESKRSVAWITVDLMRLIFQNFMLEERSEAVQQSLELWVDLVNLLEIAHNGHSEMFVDMFSAALPLLFGLVMSPIGTPIDPRLFVQFSSSQKLKVQDIGMNVSPQDRSMLKQDMTIITFDDVILGRVAGLSALGKLVVAFLKYPNLVQDLKLKPIMVAYLSSAHACHRLFAGILVEQCSANFSGNGLEVPLISELWTSMVQTLLDTNAGASLLYQELTGPMNALYHECVTFRRSLEAAGHGMPTLPKLVGEASEDEEPSPFGSVFTHAVAEALLAMMPDTKDEHITILHSRVTTLLQNYKSLQHNLEIQVQMSFSCAVVSLDQLPPKINPVVRALMNSVKMEECEILQGRAAKGIANLIRLNTGSDTRTSVNEKLVKNICVFLCSDANRVGTVDGSNVGILTLKRLNELQERKAAAKGKKRKQKQEVEDLDAAAAAAIESAAKTEADEAERKALDILHRGAEHALKHICQSFGDRLFLDIPKLFEILSAHLFAESEHFGIADSSVKAGQPSQQLADGLHVIAIIAPYIDKQLHGQLLELVKPVSNCLKCSVSLIRYLASRALAALCDTLQVPALSYVVNNLLVLANDSRSDTNRQGVVEAIYHIVEVMQDRVIPYLVFLIVPLLGRMSDSNEHVRFTSTNVFAQLVKLSPLESGVPNPEGFSQEMIDKKQLERKFIGQLIGSEKVAEFELPIPIKAELRSYQKEGVSWLAFLNRYGLHGILCDDMGLGKTLQSICMMASDHFERAKEFKRTGALDKAHCPSLVVCPSTLTGHWYFEIGKYADFMKPVVYGGDKGERAMIRKKMQSWDIVIVSYEVLRNDLESLEKHHFNYVTLDEGHVIKNPNTKLTKAVKAIKGFHRIILSGTPIQNNVLELWSLFDFLMPGFLGTEAQFNDRFGKPIASSRDAKASSRDQEQGALALEALHKQVLPFLMRRMKEDVLDDLPPKIIQDYYCELNDIQRMLYQDFSKSKVSDEIKADVANSKEKQSNTGQQHIFQALQYLRKLCNHPAFVLTPEHPKHHQVHALLKQQGRKLNDIQNSPKIMALQ